MGCDIIIVIILVYINIMDETLQPIQPINNTAPVESAELDAQDIEEIRRENIGFEEIRRENIGFARELAGQNFGAESIEEYVDVTVKTVEQIINPEFRDEMFENIARYLTLQVSANQGNIEDEKRDIEGAVKIAMRIVDAGLRNVTMNNIAKTLGRQGKIGLFAVAVSDSGWPRRN